MAIVKMCEPDTEDSRIALQDRINVLEEKLARGEFTVAVKTEKQPKADTDLPWDEDKKPEKKSEAQKPEPKAAQVVSESASSPAVSAGGGAVASRWAEIINHIKTHGGMPLYPHLMNVRAKEVNGKLCVVFGENVAMSKSIVSKASNIALIKDAVAAVTGETMEVACVTPKEIGEEPDNPLKKLEELAKTHSEIQFI